MAWHQRDQTVCPCHPAEEQAQTVADGDWRTEFSGLIPRNIGEGRHDRLKHERSRESLRQPVAQLVQRNPRLVEHDLEV